MHGRLPPAAKGLPVAAPARTRAAPGHHPQSCRGPCRGELHGSPPALRSPFAWFPADPHGHGGKDAAAGAGWQRRLPGSSLRDASGARLPVPQADGAQVIDRFVGELEFPGHGCPPEVAPVRDSRWSRIRSIVGEAVALVSPEAYPNCRSRLRRPRNPPPRRGRPALALRQSFPPRERDGLDGRRRSPPCAGDRGAMRSWDEFRASAFWTREPSCLPPYLAFPTHPATLPA